MRSGVVGAVERFHKDKLTIKRTVDDSLSKLKTYKLRCDGIDEKILELKNKSDVKKNEIVKNANDLGKLVKKYVDKIDKESAYLDNERDLMTVQVYKSNIQLLNSQILFDTALSKFELINAKMNTLITGEEPSPEADTESQDIQARLEQCLKKAMKTRHLVEHIGSQKQETFDLSSITAKLDAEMDHPITPDVSVSSTAPYATYDSFPEFKIYTDATDLALMDLQHNSKHKMKNGSSAGFPSSMDSSTPMSPNYKINYMV
ncbi:unnamed protein product [Ambrosiozyma monospora]|uniref:Unnamed protein product n=1 Tax=Ambrosiozyma monospora TaxID=43982 RepID=A0ACB5U920_AMBMO|nr:unnamed protein product [Ambrosiozyma monospora]